MEEARSNHGVGLALHNLIHQLFEKNRIGQLRITSERSLHVEDGKVIKSDEKVRGTEITIEIPLKEEHGAVFIDSIEASRPEEALVRSEARMKLLEIGIEADLLPNEFKAFIE